MKHQGEGEQEGERKAEEGIKKKKGAEGERWEQKTDESRKGEGV